MFGSFATFAAIAINVFIAGNKKRFASGQEAERDEQHISFGLQP